MQICHRFGTKKLKLPSYCPTTGIKTNKKHYLTFSVNRPIMLNGFGIYGTITAKENVTVDYAIYVNDFCHSVTELLCLAYTTQQVTFDGHRNITKLYFEKPIKLKCSQEYILCLDVDSYKTYRGFEGLLTIRLDKVEFKFNPQFDKCSQTTTDEGNIPELYYTLIRT